MVNVFKENSYVYPRSEMMISILLFGYNDFDELEFIFGRSRKTIYRDLKNARDFILANGFDDVTIQKYLNKSFKHLCRCTSSISNESKREIIINCATELQRIFNYEIDVDLFLMINHVDDKSEVILSCEDEHLIEELYQMIVQVLEYNLDTNLKFLNKVAIKSHLERNLLIYKYGVDDNIVIDNNIFWNYNIDYQLIEFLITSVFSKQALMISPANISYLITYFLVDLARAPKKIRIVCPMGIATSQIIKLTIENYFIDQVDDEDYDFSIIVGRENPTANVNDIYINTLDCEQLIVTLSKVLTLKPSLEAEIFQLYTNLKSLLNNDVTYNDFKKKVLLSRNKVINRSPMLRELIIEKTISFPKEIATWQEAIKYGNDILVADGSTTPGYADEMIESVELYGPYVILVPNFAMPHAKSETNIKKTGMSLVILEEPVLFPGEKEVRVLLTLCSKDNKDHLEALSELTTFLTKDDFLDNLIACKNTKETLKLLEE